MSHDRAEVTKKHLKGIKSAITAFGSNAELARYLKISPANIYAWSAGLRLIPICHAEAIHQACEVQNITFLDLRPDLARLEKYFK